MATPLRWKRSAAPACSPIPTTMSPATPQSAAASPAALLCSESGRADAGEEGRHLGFQIVGARRQSRRPGGDLADGAGAAGHRLCGGADFARGLRGVAGGVLDALGDGA